MTDRPLAGRRALITGGSRGIGAATARVLAHAGARVAVTARTRPALDALVAELNASCGAGHVSIAADLTTDPGMDAVVSQARQWAGGAPDIIVNNAGSFVYARIDEIPADEFARALRINLDAPFRLVHAFLAAMRARRSGDIVTVGSVADHVAFTSNVAYNASKFGLRAVHEVLRAETLGSGVRAILVSPAAVDTDVWTPLEAELGKTLPARDAMLAPDDVARAICFAVSQPARVDIEELRIASS